MAAAPIPTSPNPDASGTTPLSQAARVTNMFFAPSSTFNDLRRSASWWVPWLLISVVSLMFVYAMDRQVGFEQISRNEIARNPKAAEQFDKLSTEQRAKNLQISSSIARDISYGVPIIQLISFLVMAGVLLATFNFAAGAGVPFKTALAIVIYSSVPSLIGAVLGIVSLFAGVDPAGFQARNPVATNPAYFMDPAGNKFLYAMASTLDVFVIWTIILVGIGFACNSKVKRGTAIAIVAGWYLAYKMIGAAF
jgi:hypothetical protein